MNDLIKPGEGVLFMKVGSHAQEDLAAIIARKTEEIRRTGFGMWGYGGNTCHPTSMVQPFARSFAERGRTIHLVMEEMPSSHRAEPLSAKEYSVDGLKWETIPETIDIRGSRYALVIEGLRPTHFDLPLDQTRVPVGPNTGRLGSRYIQGRVDKACLEIMEAAEVANEGERRIIPINLVADLRPPFAVFLRGQRE